MNSISQDQYSDFFYLLNSIIDSGRSAISSQSSLARSKYYLNIGSCINNFIKSDPSQALDNNFTTAITQSTGISRTQVFLSVKFSSIYTITQIESIPSVTWAHYKELIFIEDPLLRKDLENRIIKESLTTRQFSNLIRSVKSNNVYKIPPLIPPPMRLKTFRTKKVLDSKVIDLGLHIYNKTHMINSDFVRIDSDSSGNITITPIVEESPPLYTYTATILKIVDADTFVMTVDHGLGIISVGRFRLRGLDSYEIGTKEGQTALNFVTSRIKPEQKVVIRTHRSDIYGRYLIDLIYSTTSDNADEILRSGIYLNRELLDNGHAIPY